MKKMFSFKNVTILSLISIIAVLIVIIFNLKNDAPTIIQKDAVSYKYDEEKTICQHEYYYYNNDTYLISLCNNDIYITKNNSDRKKLEIDNASYLYNYYTVDNSLFYILTNDGDVFYLSVDNINNESYTVEKLDLKDIVNIKDFYIGMNMDDSYNYKIYAINKNGSMTLIK